MVIQISTTETEVKKASKKTGFSKNISSDMKRLNEHLEKRNQAMKLTKIDKERVFCFNSNKLSL